MTDNFKGWANYPTWAIWDFFLNDEAEYNYIFGMARKCRDAVKLSRMIEAELKEGNPLATKSEWSVYKDLMVHVLEQVEWYALACQLIEDTKEEE